MGQKEKQYKILICYASQKGMAESIAKSIFDQLKQLDAAYDAFINSMSEVKDLNFFKNYLCTIFIGSTTGDGDPPDTAQKFMRHLRKVANTNKSHPWLSYTILGLGDTNYNNFCNFGKTLEKYLQSVKALRFYNCGWADDGTGLEDVVDPWIEGLFPALKIFLESLPTNLENFPNKCSITEREKIDSEKTTDNFLEVSESKELEEFSFEADKSIIDHALLIEKYPKLDIRPKEDIENSFSRRLKFEREYPLTIPRSVEPYIVAKYKKDEELVSSTLLDSLLSLEYPFQNSKILSFKIEDARKLTSDDAVKTTLELSLSCSHNESFSYEPGDTIGILTPNREDEVDLILSLLNLTHLADKKLVLSLDQNTTRKVANLPKHIPKSTTLRFVLTYCLDIRFIPRKPVINCLVNFTTDPTDKRRMQELVSKEGLQEYSTYVRESGMTFIDLLILFPSCKPPVNVLVENLPRLLPRAYSITSSPLDSPKAISFAFNVSAMPTSDSHVFYRKGLCTGWLQKTSQPMFGDQLKDSSEISNLKPPETNILLYFRTNIQFRLPVSLNTPVIMVGPGTGVAPFLGFLKHRRQQLKALDTVPDTNFTWLFFGCRNRDKDYLFENELESLKNSKVLTRLSVSFSRDSRTTEDTPRYVQDNIIKHSKELVDLVDDKNAIIYVCGDARNMSKNVMAAFEKIFKENLDLNDEETSNYMTQLRLKGRYLQDVWA